ncbi:MAG TPA: hypothetical protein VFT74_22230 [Isosphaeraceae bacterium]|nr:hypothetical protein [Isosphaeraceae bacterium]
MPIINTLARCLDSPYLFLDPDAPGRVEGCLAFATDRLQMARNLIQSSPDSADVSLFAYEAMFAAMRALVYHRGYREAGLRCLLIACEALFVREGLLDGAHLQAFERLQALKLPPAEALAESSTFLERVRAILESGSVSS